MNSDQALIVLRQILNVPAVKLSLSTVDIYAAEEALRTLDTAVKAVAKPAPTDSTST